MQLILGQGLEQVIDELRRLREPVLKADTDGPAGLDGPEASANVTQSPGAGSSMLQKRELGRVAQSLFTGRLVTECLEAPASGLEAGGAE